MKLSELKINTKFKITKNYIDDDKLRMRIKELGLYENAECVLYKKSMLGNTFLLNILNTFFAIKKNVAKQIEVEKIL